MVFNTSTLAHRCRRGASTPSPRCAVPAAPSRPDHPQSDRLLSGGKADRREAPIAVNRTTAYPSWMRSFVYLLLPLLAACDAWPTVVDNRTQSQLTVRYLHRDYDQWSAPFPVSAGKAMPLARAHWIQDVRALRIDDRSRSYSVSGDALQRINDACPSTEMGRRFSTAGTCYLIYLGVGRLQTMAATPRGLEYEEVGNGS